MTSKKLIDDIPASHLDKQVEIYHRSQDRCYKIKRIVWDKDTVYLEFDE